MIVPALIESLIQCLPCLPSVSQKVSGSPSVNASFESSSWNEITTFTFNLHHKSWLNTWTWGMDRISKRLSHSYAFTLTLSLQRSHEQLSIQSALQFLCQFGEFGIRSPYISLIDNIFFFMTVVCLILYWHRKEKFCLDHSKK